MVSSPEATDKSEGMEVAVQQQQRDSDLFPRNLSSLFASSPQDDVVRQPHGLAVAGSRGAGVLDLERMQVVLRIRPPASGPLPQWDPSISIHATSATSIAIAAPETSQGYKNGDRGQTYHFTRVCGQETTQEEYFGLTAASMVRELLAPQPCSSVLMAYGISAAGKTFTIEGTKAAPGMLPQALNMLFAELKDRGSDLAISISNYEIYNESIFDLLRQDPAPIGGRPALRLKEDGQGRMFVDGAQEVPVTSADEALEVLRRGSRARQKARTALNQASSRSHSIFTVMVDSRQGGELRRLSFVDLAGSERAGRTGNHGARLKESVAINASLMTLGRCLEALRWNQQHPAAEQRLVPYREARVTHLFRDVLHGWGRVLLSVNVSPCARDYDETSHVLKYAAMATQIGNAARLDAPGRRAATKAASPVLGAKRARTTNPLQLPAPRPAADTAGLDAEAADAAREALEQQVMALQQRCDALEAELAGAEAGAALSESDVRDEVASEMRELLCQMEANYKERLAAELRKLQENPGSGGAGGSGSQHSEGAAGSQPAATQSQDSAPMADLQRRLAEAAAAAAAANRRAEAAEAATDGLRQRLQEAERGSREWEAHAARLQVQVEDLQQERSRLQTELAVLQDGVQGDLLQQQANEGMQREMLEQQLAAAQQEAAGLRGRLDSATAQLCAAATPSNPALLAVLKAAVGAESNGQRRGTPHEVALARVRGGLLPAPSGTAPSQSRLASGEQSQHCEQALFQRSTPSTVQHTCPGASPLSGGPVAAGSNGAAAVASGAAVRDGRCGRAAGAGGNVRAGEAVLPEQQTSPAAQDASPVAPAASLPGGPSPQVMLMSQASTQASVDKQRSGGRGRTGAAAGPSPLAAFSQLAPPDTAGNGGRDADAAADAIAAAQPQHSPVNVPDVQHVQNLDQQQPAAEAAQPIQEAECGTQQPGLEAEMQCTQPSPDEPAWPQPKAVRKQQRARKPRQKLTAPRGSRKQAAAQAQAASEPACERAQLPPVAASPPSPQQQQLQQQLQLPGGRPTLQRSAQLPAPAKQAQPQRSPAGPQPQQQAPQRQQQLPSGSLPSEQQAEAAAAPAPGPVADAPPAAKRQSSAAAAADGMPDTVADTEPQRPPQPQPAPKQKPRKRAKRVAQARPKARSKPPAEAAAAAEPSEPHPDAAAAAAAAAAEPSAAADLNDQTAAVSAAATAASRPPPRVAFTTAATVDPPQQENEAPLASPQPAPAPRGRKRKLLPATPALLGRLAKLDGEGSPDGGGDAGGDIAGGGTKGRGAFAQLRGRNGDRPVRRRRATQFFGF